MEEPTVLIPRTTRDAKFNRRRFKAFHTDALLYLLAEDMDVGLRREIIKELMRRPYGEGT